MLIAWRPHTFLLRSLVLLMFVLASCCSRDAGLQEGERSAEDPKLTVAYTHPEFESAYVVCNQRGERADWSLTLHPDIKREGTALLDLEQAFKEFASAAASDPTLAVIATNLPQYRIHARLREGARTMEAEVSGTFEQLDAFTRRTDAWLALHRELANTMHAKNWILFMGYDHARGVPLGQSTRSSTGESPTTSPSQ